MKRLFLVLLIICSVLAVGCDDGLGPSELPEPTPGGGFIVETSAYVEGIITVNVPDVSVLGTWEGDLPGAEGSASGIIGVTNALGLLPLGNARAPANWNMTWVTSPDATFDGCNGESVVGTAYPGEALVMTCIVTEDDGSAPISDSFSLAPNPIYSLSATSSGTVSGSGFNTTYGMPLIQYYGLDGTLVDQEYATSVSSGGTTAQFPGFNTTTLAPGVYVGFLSNAGTSGTYNYLGTTSVTVITPNVSVLGGAKYDEGDAIYDIGTVSVTVNGLTESASYDGTPGEDIPGAIASAFNANTSSPVSAVTTPAGAGPETLWFYGSSTSTTAMAISVNSESDSGDTYFAGVPSYVPIPSQTVTGSGSVTVVGGYVGNDSDGYNTGTITVSVNGVSESVCFGCDPGGENLPAELASAFNSDPQSPVTASVSGSYPHPLTLTSNVSSSTPLTISGWQETDGGPLPQQISFLPLPSASVLGSERLTILGADLGDPTDGYDNGNVQVTVNGFTEYYSYGTGETASHIASSLAASFNSSSSSPVTASASGNVLTLTSKSGSSTLLNVSAIAPLSDFVALLAGN
jgi:hypothetical protein